MKPMRLFFGLLVCLAVAVPATTTADDGRGNRPTAADFELRTLKGERVRLSELRGKVVLVSFWATWCKPCLAELPYVSKYHRQFGNDGFVALAVATDGPQTRSRVRSVAKRHRFAMPVLVDDTGCASSALNPRGTNPYTVLVDRRGRIAYQHEGYSPGDEVGLRQRIESLLKESR